MWCINPLKIYPDLSPLFIIWLNSAVNLQEVFLQLEDDDYLLYAWSGFIRLSARISVFTYEKIMLSFI